jgi:hypothetical protein
VASDGFERLATVASYWNRSPSSYLIGLPSLHAFWIDEAAAVWLAEKQKQEGHEEFVGEDIL